MFDCQYSLRLWLVSCFANAFVILSRFDAVGQRAALRCETRRAKV